MPLKLVAVIGDRALALTSGRGFLVGRAIACDLLISDPTVSRQHAELESSSAGVIVHDLQSTNGTYVNGTRIEGPTMLVRGDLIQVGQIHLQVEVGEASGDRTTIAAP